MKCIKKIKVLGLDGYLEPQALLYLQNIFMRMLHVQGLLQEITEMAFFSKLISTNACFITDWLK